MKYSELRVSSLIVGHGGGDLLVFEGDTQVAALGFGPGLHRLNNVAQYFAETHRFEPGPGTVVGRRDGNRTRIVQSELFTESGANADFQPRRMTDTEAQMLKMVRNVENRVKAAEKREKLLAERLAARAEPLVEDETPEEPAPAEIVQAENEASAAE